MSGTNFRGERKHFPKPSAFESEIHPPHKTSFCTSGISPLQGANPRRRGFTVRKSRTVFSMRPKGRDAWTALLSMASFRGKCEAAPAGLRRSPFAAVRKRQSQFARIRASVRDSCPMAASHRKSGGIGLLSKEGDRHL